MVGPVGVCGRIRPHPASCCDDLRRHAGEVSGVRRGGAFRESAADGDMRRVYLVSAVVFGVLLNAAAAVWVRSLWYLDGHWRDDLQPGGKVETVAVHAGGLYLMVENKDCPPDPFSEPKRSGTFHVLMDPPPEFFITSNRLHCRPNAWGFGFSSGRFPGAPWPMAAEMYRVHRIPLWLPTLVFAAAASACTWAWHRRRPRPGRCGACGYDLRATAAKCPECGAEAEVKTIRPVAPSNRPPRGR